MRRRKFITLLGSALAWPTTARAQHVGKHRIAFITQVLRDIIYEPLFEDLRELGYVEGQNIIIERLYAEGKPERFSRSLLPEWQKSVPTHCLSWMMP
jgi:putative ABC transport system substrate-binding protein